MNLQELSSKIKQAVNSLFTADKAKELLEKLEKAAANSSNRFWWLKLIALVNIVIVELEDEDKELSGASKKTLAEEVFGPIWDAYVPGKIKTLNTLSFGYLKKTCMNLIIDGLVLAFNMTFGKKWIQSKAEEK